MSEAVVYIPISNAERICLDSLTKTYLNAGRRSQASQAILYSQSDGTHYQLAVTYPIWETLKNLCQNAIWTHSPSGNIGIYEEILEKLNDVELAVRVADEQETAGTET